MKNNGYVVLRLPPYHPDLNPIELIWAQVKNWTAAHNVTFKTADVTETCKSKFESITVDDWKKMLLTC